ncbi:MAG: tRNA lysidine(34) synthetase TilS [Pseudobdellovibrionaceae bacterium]
MSQERKKRTWQALEHKVCRELKSQNLTGKKLLLACSGGADSQVLMHLMSRVAVAIEVRLGVVSVHHGGSSSFRKRTLEFCKNEAAKLGLPFHSEKSERALKSEKEMRDFRYLCFRKIAQEQGYDLIVTAHHQDDLLETRILRLIRGVGVEGLVAIAALRGNLLRPFLHVSRAELQKWLSDNKIFFVTDPSNLETHYLRNWVRNDWLPALNQKQPGAVKSLARSLSLLARSRTPFKLHNFLTEGGISRMMYNAQSSDVQKQILFHYGKSMGSAEISSGQVEEIRRRLDRSQRMHTFRVAGLLWQVNAEQIFARENVLSSSSEM